jgi:phosphoglycolate phosphatase
MKNKFDLIIFDWDGTLIDSTGWIAHCLQQAGLECGLPCPELQAAKDVIGLSIYRAMQTLFPQADANIQEQLVQHYSRHYSTKRLSPDDLFAGVYSMLVRLQATGYNLAVATGKTRAGLDRALEETETREIFCVTRCADETASKPDPMMLNEIIKHINMPRERTLLVGDSIHDLQMALNANISSVAVSCGAHPADILHKYQPLHCLTQPTELLNLI